jgi:hypothetical protein
MRDDRKVEWLQVDTVGFDVMRENIRIIVRVEIRLPPQARLRGMLLALGSACLRDLFCNETIFLVPKARPSGFPGLAPRI